MIRRLALGAAPIVGLLSFFVLWEGYVRVMDVQPLTLPPPSRIVAHVFDDLGFYADNAVVTATEAGLGLVLAFVAALLTASAMIHSPIVERASWPVIVMIQSTPVVVLAPVFLRWLGFGIGPKVLVAALFTFVPFVSNAFTGLRSIDADRWDLLRSVDASRREIFWRLRVPTALPSLFAAGRICVPLSLVGAVVGELYGSTSGLGYQTRIAGGRGLIDRQWGSIFVASFIGITGTLLLLAVERRALRWNESTPQP